MKSHTLELPAKASDLKELKAIFISDVHFGVSWNIQRIQSFVKQMNQLDLDLLLIGGDFFDECSPEKEKEEVVQALSQIKSRYGQFYIEGNYEYKSENIDI